MAKTPVGRVARRGIAGGVLALVTVLAAPTAALAEPGVLGGARTVGTPRLSGAGVTGGQVTIVGSGFGHGVGMSQYGALGMARAGSDAAGILKHYYTGVDVSPYRDDTDVRVNVVHGATDVTLAATALAAGGGALTLVPDTGPPVTAAAGSRVLLVPAAGAVRATVTDATGAATTLLTPGLDVRWPGTALQRGAATTVQVASTAGGRRKSRSYRWGGLRFTPVGSLLDGIAVLDVHDAYLRGVAEMPSSWPAAALQAQVVAARGYALVAAGTAPRASCGGCQLWDDSRSQVYLGWAKESETVGTTRYGDRWVAAVTATEASADTGLTVLYRGRPVTTYFASSTGGRTRDAADVWGSPLPYLTSVADPWSTDPAVNPGYARWTRTVAVTRLLALFRLPDLTSLAVTARDSSGAARAVTATSSSGTSRTLSGNSLASGLGLPGAWVSTLALPAAATGSRAR